MQTWIGRYHVAWVPPRELISEWNFPHILKILARIPISIIIKLSYIYHCQQVEWQFTLSSNKAVFFLEKSINLQNIIINKNIFYA